MSHSSAFLEIDKVASSIELLFGSSCEGKRLTDRCLQTRSEFEAIATRRGVTVVPIAVLGSKNAGKSWLCRRLVSDPANRARIPCGENREDATTSATWIGPSAPPEMDADHEIYLPMPAQAMVDLGRPYNLLDLPGYNDASIPEREAALRAIHGTPLRVFVVSSQTMEDESQFSYLTQSDGVVILPVVVDNHFPGLAEDGNADLTGLVRRLNNHCPRARIILPIVIPHTLHSPGGEEENTQRAEDILLPALRAALAEPEIDPALAIEASLDRFRVEIASDLRPWMDGIRPAYDELVAEESGLAAELVGKIIGTDTQLTAGMTMRMRMRAFASAPAEFFPYRTILGVFALTAGAWDRMAFAMAGSVPSLALLAFQTSRNVKNLGEMMSQAKETLSRRVEAMANERLSALDEIFVRSTRSFLPPSAQPFNPEGRKVRIVGLDIVTEKSAEIFESTLKKYSPGRLLTGFWGGLATIAFFGLGASPTVAVYREFFEAWAATFADNPARWDAFPAPSGEMMFSTLLIMIIPVVLCALLTIANSAPKRTVASAVNDVKAAHKRLRTELAESGLVRLVSDDPIREAVREIQDFIALSTKN
jgi:hypothetical protein